MNNEKNSDKDIPWRLLLRDFKENLSEEEKIKLSMWMNSSASSGEMYAALKKLWIVLLGNQLENKKELDVDSLWDKMEQRLHQRVPFGLYGGALLGLLLRFYLWQGFIII